VPVTSTHPYDALTPDCILDAVESFGPRSTGGLLALNSYENRVYRVDTEEQGALVAKFYRPGRWSDAAILEEHAFVRELAQQEIPAVCPLQGADNNTLFTHAGFRFALFPWQPGRAPELNTDDDRRMLGRYLGRLHRVGRSATFHARPVLSVETFGREPVAFLLEHGFIPDYLQPAWRSLTDALLQHIDAVFDAIQPRRLRLHGDCHLGNILWTGTGAHIVDFDDCRTGPAVQDLWMLLSGGRDEMQQQLTPVLEGYTQFMDFDPAELALVEPLRTLRLLHYSAWLARRWDDPAFPHNFPWFNSTRYWEDQVLALREQEALLGEAPLAWQP
jgi:Ser/Thr protein kinase RdoA (MazF antagonist)